MAPEGDVPVDLYVAAYSDPDAAREDWSEIEELAKGEAINVEALLLVRRGADGTIREQDNAHAVGVGTALGAAGGSLIGLIFPPALVGSTAVDAETGAGGLVSHPDKKVIKAEVANDLPVGSCGILVLLDGRSVVEAEQALSRADNVSKHKVDGSSIEHARTGRHAASTNVA